MHSPTMLKSLQWLPLLFILGISCSKKKTQREFYEETTSGITYNTYKVASGAAVSAAVKIYNSQQPDTVAALDPAFAHLLLGCGWTFSKKPSMAFAEAALAGEGGDDVEKFLAQSLRSIAMYEQGWDTLAREEAQAAKKNMTLEPGYDIQYKITVFYMLMGLVKAYEQDFEQSKFYWAGFATETGIHWPYKLTDAIDNLQHNRIQASLIKFKALSQDPDVPPALQKALKEQIDSIEAKAGDVNSKLFWPRLIAVVVFDQLKKSSNSQVGAIIREMEEVREKL